MAKGTVMQNDRYTCPLGEKRDRCACPDCLEWRYQEIKAGANPRTLK